MLAEPSPWPGLLDQLVEQSLHTTRGVRHGEKRYSMWSGKFCPVWLHAHHVNADPANPVPELEALCPSCHWQCKNAAAALKLEKLKHQQLLGIL